MLKGTLKDLTGKRFSRLVVLTYAGKSQAGKSLWLTQCDCGRQKVAVSGELTRGTTRSCGCLASKLRSEARTTHGMAGSPTYMAWARMHSRCAAITPTMAKSYKDKGIKVCAEWGKFENFLTDMGVKPEGLSLERKRNNEGYCKENCTWATAKEQANNRGTSKRYVYKGSSYTAETLMPVVGVFNVSASGRYYHVKKLLSQGLITEEIKEEE